MKKPISPRYLLAYWILLSFFRISGQQKTDSLLRSTTSHYKSSLLFNGHISENTKALGGKFMVTLFLKTHPDNGIGFNLASEKLFIQPNKLNIPSNITTNILFGVAGFHIQNKLNEQVFFQPEFSFLYGRQEITKLISTPSNFNQYGVPITYKYSEEKTEQNIMGVHFEQHFLFYPIKAKGLVLGLSLFERFLKAEYYKNDIGICGYIGINLN